MVQYTVTGWKKNKLLQNILRLMGLSVVLPLRLNTASHFLALLSNCSEKQKLIN